MGPGQWKKQLATHFANSAASAGIIHPPLPPDTVKTDVPKDEEKIHQPLFQDTLPESSQQAALKEESSKITEKNTQTMSQDFSRPIANIEISVSHNLNRNLNRNVMCKAFARGYCHRGAENCRYIHKVIVAQLRGVFIFCKDFQNKVCTKPHCKYVHATIFEEMSFFRIGYLPRHTMAHWPASVPRQYPFASFGPHNLGSESVVSELPARELAVRVLSSPSHVSPAFNPTNTAPVFQQLNYSSVFPAPIPLDNLMMPPPVFRTTNERLLRCPPPPPPPRAMSNP